MQDRPPASFVASQVSIAISNYMTQLAHQAEMKLITHQEYLQKQFPEGAHSLVERAAASAVTLWNANQNEEVMK